MRRLPLLVLTCAALVARRLRRTRLATRRRPPPPPRPPGRTSARSRTYLLDHTERLQADVVELRAERRGLLRAGRSRATSTTQELLADAPRRGREADEGRKADLRRRQPGLRGDGGRRRRRARARRLRRDHRRRRRRARIPRTPSRSRSRPPDGRTFKQPGNFFFLIETLALRHRAEVRRQGVADLDGDGKVDVRRGAARRATSTLAAARTSRAGDRARRRREEVDADASRTRSPRWS